MDGLSCGHPVLGLKRDIGLTAMFLMNKQDMMEKDEILEFVQSCQHDNGGFGASQNHDSHLLYTSKVSF